MKVVPKNDQEKRFTFSEIADEIGVPESELLEIAQKEGLIDENGNPTQFAIDEGLFDGEQEQLSIPELMMMQAKILEDQEKRMLLIEDKLALIFERLEQLKKSLFRKYP